MATMRMIAVAGLAAALLSACAQTTPRWDERFGESVRANLAVQVINPAAGANPNPAAGIDGKAARAAYERYVESFQKPEANAPRALIEPE